jgi:DNA-directed RNA polymerase
LDKELILSAESPFIFTAFCLNMREYHNNPDALIKTPVFLDATCSGIQHLAGLMKDLELGANTNLVKSTIKQKPGDVYQTLLEPINKAINEFGKNNIEFSMLSLVKLTRKEVKTPIMTKVYNVTKYGISKQLQSVFKIKNSEIFENEFYTKPLKEVQKDILESLKQNKGKDNESDIFACNGIDGKKVILTKKEVFKIASIINEQIFVVFPSLNKIYNYFID